MSTSRLSLRPLGRPRTRRVRGDAALPVTPWDSAAPRARGPRARHLGGSRGHLTLRPSSSLPLCPLRPLSTHTRHAFAWRSGWLVFAFPTADGTPSAREQNARAQSQPYRDVPDPDPPPTAPSAPLQSGKSALAGIRGPSGPSGLQFRAHLSGSRPAPRKLQTSQSDSLWFIWFSSEPLKRLRGCAPHKAGELK